MSQTFSDANVLFAPRDAARGVRRDVDRANETREVTEILLTEILLTEILFCQFVNNDRTRRFAAPSLAREMNVRGGRARSPPPSLVTPPPSLSRADLLFANKKTHADKTMIRVVSRARVSSRQREAVFHRGVPRRVGACPARPGRTRPRRPAPALLSVLHISGARELHDGGSGDRDERVPGQRTGPATDHGRSLAPMPLARPWPRRPRRACRVHTQSSAVLRTPSFLARE